MKRICSLILTVVMAFGVLTSIPITVSAIDEAENTIAVEYFSIDKTLMSEGETATISVEVADGYTAKWVNLYKPITNNTETVYLYAASDNTYTGTFKVDDQTESGVWKVKSLTLEDSNGDWVYFYNSNTYTGTTRDTIDFSSIDFEVIGTSADITAPVIESYSINKNTVSNGESVTIIAKIIDEHLSSSFDIWYISPSNTSKLITMKKVDDTGLYQGTLTINLETEIGLWRPRRFCVYDTNGNGYDLYNSNVTSYGNKKTDLSALNFEVIEISEDNEANENSGSFIVLFKDGYGNTLSTQRVAKGEDAVEPVVPTNELYVFNGWDTDFSNVTSNLTVTAKWILDPNVVYDYEIHQGYSFNVEVFSQVSQNFTITCNENADFVTSLYGTSYTISNGTAYYGKEYKITVNEPGSYVFYVKGSRATNTLSYKVKVTPHTYITETISPTCIAKGYTKYICSVCETYYLSDYVEKTEHIWADDYIVDTAETCVADGIKSVHCSYCNCIKEGSQIIIPATGHTLSDWIIDTQATCVETGTMHKECVVCEEKLETGIIPPTANHVLSDWIIDAQASCIEVGSKHKECTVCGEVLETAVIPQLKCATPKLTKVANTVSGVKVTWGAVEGADSYRVYRRAGGVYTWSYIGTTTDTSFTDSKATNNKYWIYTVIAVNEAGYSGFDKVGKTIKCVTAPKVTGVSNAANGLYVKWNAVPGAKEYRVYRKGLNYNSWLYLGTTKNTWFTDSPIKNANGYYYKYTVIAVNDYYSGFYEDCAFTKRLSNPVLKSAVSSKTGITVKWNSVYGSTGYYVYRKTANSGWTLVGSTKGTNNATYIDKTAKKGVTYTYTVRAYYGKTLSSYNSGISCKDKY